MKKIGKIGGIVAVVMVLLLLLMTCGSGGSKSASNANWPAMNELSQTEISDIDAVEYSRAGEGGVENGSTSDATEIENIYLRLKDVTLGNKTDMSVVDDDLSVSVKAGEKSINFYFTGDIAVLDNGSHYETENLSSLKSYINGLIDAAGPSEAMQNASDYKVDFGDGVTNYDITKGMETNTNAAGDIKYMYFNDFMITMPNNEKWSLETDTDSVTFYLFSAQQEGYGGRLVTIRGYDMDDNSYENLPSYHVAGVAANANVRLIAIYPTDVQYNANDAGQAADYQDLYTYLQKIGEGAVNSPLQTADSNPAP